MHLVDANVLVYAVNQAAPEHVRCRAHIDAWHLEGRAWGTTWPVLYEFLRVVTHPRGLARPLATADAWRFVEGLLAHPGFRVILSGEDHARWLARTLEELPQLRGSVLHDVHLAVAMREHGIRTIWTRDADFHRFPFLEVIDPLDPRAGGGEGVVRERPRRPVRPRGSRTPSSRR